MAVKRGKRMKYFSTFTGAGGFEQGMPTDWECVGMSEVDRYANMVLKYHYPNVINYGDITKIEWDKIPDFNLLVGGSPCQDLSIAGNRKGLSGERSGLFFAFAKALRDKQPDYFIWENVAGALSSNRGADFGTVLYTFSQEGYNLWWQILNAKDFNTAQNRERIFIVGVRKGSPKTLYFERKDEGTYFIREERTKPKAKFYSSITTKEGGRKENNFILIPSATKKGFEVAEEGDGLSLAHIGSATGRGRVGDKKSQALVSGGTAYTIQNKEIRKLMPIECERLMTWQDNWTKYGIDEEGKQIELSDTQRYKLCGNGVVSTVIKELTKWLVV